jgi:hypothetical protein
MHLDRDGMHVPECGADGSEGVEVDADKEFQSLCSDWGC